MMMEEGVIKHVFKHYNGFPVPVFASVTAEKCITFSSDVHSNTKSQNLTISTEWSQYELDRGVQLRFCQQWNLRHNQKTVEHLASLGPCISTHGELLSTHPPSGTRRAVIRETSTHGVVHQYLEVWGNNGLKKSLDLKALNKHGKVCDNGQFACLVWSPCEKRILYVAEKKREEASGEEKDRNVYMEDWGEGLTGKRVPVLCVAELSKEDVTVWTGVPSHVSPGQALWAADGRGLIFVGWWHEPFRLGLKFCSNRRSALFYIDSKGNCELLSSDTGSVLSPRLSPDCSWLIYLQGQVFGPHHQCLRMILLFLSLPYEETEEQSLLKSLSG